MILCVGVCGCDSGADSPKARLANPASENCVAKGGRHVTEPTPAGEMGICLFEDNRQCEEWALLRGHCPVGGIHVAGFTSDEERHCAIRGGRTQQAQCSLPAGESP
jgi:putative hemolysin